LLVAFAAKNVEPVTLRFYFDLALERRWCWCCSPSSPGALFGMLALHAAAQAAKADCSSQETSLFGRTRAAGPGL